MKKLYLSALVALGLIIASCDPMAKINEELEEKENPVSKQTEYTLTSSDYSTLASTYVKIKLADFQGAPEERVELEKKYKEESSSLSSNHAFNDKATASLLVPYLLSSKFPEWSKGSSVMVNYNQMAHRSEKQEAVWNTDLVEFDEATLKAMGFTSIRDFQDGGIEALFYKAKEMGATENSILVKLSYEDDSRYIHLLDRLESSSQDYYVVQPEDYDAMGLKYGNLSSSDHPDHYIPIFLSHRFPYAKEGTTYVVLYVWYANKETSARSSEYSLTNGVWTPTSSVERKSDQFLHNGEKWLFDPTIEITLDKGDFEVLYNDVKVNHPNYISKKYPDNEEFWFGGSQYYKNFNLDGGETVGERIEEEGLSPEELLKVKEERVVDGLKLILANRFPDFPATVNGVEQYYIIKTVVRVNRNNEDRTYRFQGLGNNEYEYLPEK